VVRVVQTGAAPGTTLKAALSNKSLPNNLLGDLTAGVLSNLYYPKANRGAGLVFTNAAVGLGGRIGLNIIREFFSKHPTTNVSGDRNE
jgi:hypothetical protein